MVHIALWNPQPTSGFFTPADSWLRQQCDLPALTVVRRCHVEIDRVLVRTASPSASNGDQVAYGIDVSLAAKGMPIVGQRRSKRLERVADLLLACFIPVGNLKPPSILLLRLDCIL